MARGLMGDSLRGFGVVRALGLSHLICGICEERKGDLMRWLSGDC